MKLWIDDLRPAPVSYRWIKTVNEAIEAIKNYSLMYKVSGGKKFYKIEILDLDHDAGDCAKLGGDYIQILNWMEENNINYIPIHLHTMNPVGRENMRAIIQKNNWREV